MISEKNNSKELASVKFPKKLLKRLKLEATKKDKKMYEVLAESFLTSTNKQK
jgi:hypothetical protein